MPEKNEVRKLIENAFESELNKITDRLIKTSDP